MYSSAALLFWSTWDPFHRCWNDIKGSLKKAKCQAWRCVLELALVANLNYGPFGSSTWFFKKRSKLEQFLLSTSVSHDKWQRFQHLICMERRQAEPSSPEDQQRLLDSMACIESFLNKGPLIKLMRWFSWFESMAYITGDFFATKMILEDAEEDEGSAGEVEVEVLRLNQDHKQELNELKKRKGSWKLAPSLIHDKNLAIKDCIMAVGRASWKSFALRAKGVSSTDLGEQCVMCSQKVLGPRIG